MCYYIFEAMARNEFSLCVFVDSAKAFDTVKLTCTLGIRGVALNDSSAIY